MRIKTSLLLSALTALPLAAQEQPLSAIDWLAVQRNAPVVTVLPNVPDTPVAQSATVPDVDVQPLDSPSVGGVGLLPSSVTGLPPSLWQGSTESTLLATIDALERGRPSVPALDLAAAHAAAGRSEHAQCQQGRGVPERPS